MYMMAELSVSAELEKMWRKLTVVSSSCYKAIFMKELSKSTIKILARNIPVPSGLPKYYVANNSYINIFCRFLLSKI